MTRKQLLLKRGFSEYDIDTNFEHYKGEWNIRTITKYLVSCTEDIDCLSRLFDMDSVGYNKWCCTHYGYPFEFFAQDITPFEISPSELDPHIARLCRAVNSIGVKTCMSCDGWHNDNCYTKYMMLYMCDRYSVIWLWLITEYIFGEYWRHNQPMHYVWDEVWEPFDSEYNGLGGYARRDMMMCSYSTDNAERFFNKQDCYARFIEAHRDEFLDLRKQLISELYDKMNSGEINNIDHVGFMKASRYM